MSYSKSDFTPFSNDSQRVSANLEQIYTAWLDARRQLDAMPVSMYWASKDNADYLHVKTSSSDNGTSIGPRNADTGVVPQQSALVFGVQKVCRLVEKLSRFTGDYKTMGKAGRNP